jgi:hypothetical protein
MEMDARFGVSLGWRSGIANPMLEKSPILENGAGVEFKRQSRSQRLEPLLVNEQA